MGLRTEPEIPVSHTKRIKTPDIVLYGCGDGATAAGTLKWGSKIHDSHGQGYHFVAVNEMQYSPEFLDLVLEQIDRADNAVRQGWF